MTEVSSQMPMGRSSTSAQSAKSQNSSGINMNDFLKILAASMSNPSLGGESGGSNGGTDYISQLVQFTTLEQIQTLSSNVEYTMMMTQQQQAISMIGKEVKVMDGDKTVSGKIDKVKFATGFATIEVNGKDYLMSNILELGA
ncbi:flagellar basal body rod modification protein [uncultured Vagococcus sp.]|uniref:flagellar basal body rod modification protein n=1 Tax=uncultured Vagococcus sp. TaxID=189676 RepID=UPI0028D59C7C|nr:flagellar basal body rod modification protein [uncultured Vagococcus sp.]